MRDSSKYVPLGTACKLLGLCPQSVRRLCDEGVLETIRSLPGRTGHRRISMRSIRDYEGLDVEEEGDRRILIIGRVSSSSQKESLINQQEVLDSFVLQNYGQDELDKADKAYHVRSGLDFGDNRLIKMIDDIIKGKYYRIIVKDKTRFLRMSEGLLQMLAGFGEAEVVYTHEVEQGSDEEELVSEVLSIITIYSNRMSARRGARLTRVDMPVELVKRSIRLHMEGLSFKAIADLFEKEGVVSEKDGKPYGRGVVRSNILRSKLLKKVMNGNEVETSFDRYCSEKATFPTPLKKLIEDYQKWAKHHNYPVLSNRKVLETKSYKGFKKKRTGVGVVVEGKSN